MISHSTPEDQFIHELINRILSRRRCDEDRRMSYEQSRRLNDALQRGYDSMIAWQEAGCPWEGISGHDKN